MKKVAAVVIGGSNTVMRSGYLTSLPKCLRAAGVDLEITANLAIGNTTIQTGLMKLVESSELLASADVRLIELPLMTRRFTQSLCPGFNGGSDTWRV